MKPRFLDFGLRLGFIALLFPAVAAADSSALILSGVPGSDEHAKKFAGWTESTRQILVEQMGFSPDRVVVLSDKQATRAEIEAAFARLKQQVKPLDSFFLFFIGHGTYGIDYKFNISGADLTGADYSNLLSTLEAGRIVIVNSTASSGGAIDALRGKNRIVIAATRNGREVNDTVFYDHFLAALKDNAADEDKNQKVSIWEAYKFAAAGVERFYEEAKRLATEHPVLSDNGEEAVAATVETAPVMAAVTAFNVDRPVTVSDPRLQALLNERREIEQKIEALRINQSSMPAAEYEKQLEDLIVALALKNQEIRDQESRLRE